MSSDIYKRTLYVKNLNQPSDDTISSLFSSFGKFTHQVVFTSDSNRKDLFLEFESEDQASNARNTCHGKIVDGNNLYVDYATQIPITSSSSNQQQKSKTSVFDRIIKTTDPNYPKTDEKEKVAPIALLDRQPSDKERIVPSSDQVQQSPSQKNKLSIAKSRDESSESNAKRRLEKADNLQIKKPSENAGAASKKLEITKPKKESHSMSSSKEAPSASVRRADLNYPLRQSHDRSSDGRHYSHSKTRGDSRSRSRTREKSPSRTHIHSRRSRSHSSSRNQPRSLARRSHSRSRSHERKYGRSRSPHRDHYYDRREGDYRRDRDYRRSRSPSGTQRGYRERDRDREKPYPQKMVIGGGLVIEKKGQSRYGDDNGRDYRRSHSRERLPRRSRSRSHERSYNKASNVGKMNVIKNYRNQKQKPNQAKTNGKNNGKANGKKYKNAMTKTGGRNKLPHQQMIDYYTLNQNLGFVMATESGVIANSSNVPLYGNYYPQYQEQLVPLPISNNFFNYSNPLVANYENQAAEVSNLPSYLHQPAEIPLATDYNIYNPAQNFIENPPVNVANFNDNNGNVPTYHQYEAGKANEIRENLMEEETITKPQVEYSPAENTNDTNQIAEEKEEPKPEISEPEPEPKFQLTNEYIRKNNLGNLVNLLVRHGSIEELKQKLNLIKK